MILDKLYHSLNPVAFSIAGLEVRWYGIAYLLGFVVGGFILYRVAKRWKLNLTSDSTMTILIFVIVGILIGGRLGYCLFYGNGYYLLHPLEIFQVNKGGMSFHGALIGIIISITIASKYLKIPVFTIFDLLAIAAPLGLFFGRCANFVNGELWGAITDLPIGVNFGGSAGDVYRHPTQLYEAFLEGIVIFVILVIMSRKPRYRGTYSATFLILYGIFRIVVEFVRQPDAQIGYLFGDWLTMGMVLSIPLIIGGICILIYTNISKFPQRGIQDNV